MNESTSSFFFRCDTSSLTNFVQFCLKSLCPDHHQNRECNECDINIETIIISLLEELTGVDISNVNECNFISFVENALPSYSSNDRLYFTKSLSMIIQHTNIQSTIHQHTIQLLSQILKHNTNWCSRLSDDIGLINFIIKHILDNNNDIIYEYQILLQYISTNIAIRKIPQIKYLITNFIECIISKQESEEYTLPKLIILYNIITSKHGLAMQQYIKSLSNLKKFYKKLSRFMGNKNMWLVLYSLFILTKLVVNSSLQSQLFNQKNINIVFQLIFNLILHGASTDIKMFKISIDLLSSILSNDEIFEFLSNYPKLEKTIEKCEPLLLSFNGENVNQSSHCLLMLKLLNMLMESNKIQLMIIKLLNKHSYLTVILKLCLYHTNVNYYSDFNISIQAVKFITTLIKSQYFDDRLSAMFTIDSHHYPRHSPADSINMNNNSIISNNSNRSSGSINLNITSHWNEQFISDLRTMYFVQDACNTLFGHTDVNGNNIMKQLCFAGHIEDYSLLTKPQKYIMYFIELLNLLCKESHNFKGLFIELISIQDLSYFLCPSKNNINGEPNQIYLSLINLICSFSDNIVGISYLLKTSLCNSSLISAIINSLNSKSNAKDISNSISFIHNIFKILSKHEEYDGNNSYISGLFQNNNENNTKRRKSKKPKPRHYQRSGLTLSNVNNKNNPSSSQQNDDAMTVASTDSVYKHEFDVQNMSSKIIYQLFCKKMLRFNKTYKSNHSKIAKQAKQFENMKLKYSKSMKSMEQKLKNKDAQIQKLTSEFEHVQIQLSDKNNECMNLRQEFENLNSHFMQLQDDNQTQKHIIKDKIEKLDKMKIGYNKVKEKYKMEQNESNELRQQMDEMMNKLKCVCEGYNQLKQDSTNQINELKNTNEDIMNRMQEKCNKIDNELQNERRNVLTLENKLKETETHKMELKKNLDCMVERNSDLNYKYNQSNQEIAKLNQKLAETQKLASMIQNLMSQNRDNNS